ncbi:MAG: hypothetical protein R6V49_03145 [Bacteroidales bacterium]
MILKLSARIIITGILLASAISLNAQVEQPPFRQKVEHHISVELDDIRHVLVGTDSLIYQNNSGDTLKQLYFHVWPNAYGKGSVLSEQLLSRGNAGLHLASPSQKGEITGLVFRNRGRALRWTTHELQQDIIIVDLPIPLYPDSMLNLNIMFRLQVPWGGMGSLGHSNTSYFLSHWFPRPAIYQHDGWRVSNLHWKGWNTGEFSNINVTITLPRNYVVAASGQLYDDPEEEKWVRNINEKTRRVKRWGKRESAGFPGSVAKTKTIQMAMQDAQDFALCLDKRFHHLRDTLILPDGADTIRIHLYFTAYEAEYWSKSMDRVKSALRFMIREAGPYPYHQFTVVQTYWYDQGETYPGLIRIGTVMAPYMLESAIIRQLAQHWFTAAMAFDGQQYPWTGYGLAGHYESRYLADFYGDTITLQDVFADPAVKINLGGMKTTPLNHLQLLKLNYLAGDVKQPSDLHVRQYSKRGFDMAVLTRSVMAFNTLAGSVGKDRFDAMIRGFYSRWMLDYPSPADLRAAMDEDFGVSETQWFFNLLSSSADPDFSMISSKRVSEGYMLAIRNKTDLQLPYPVTATAVSGAQHTIWYPPHQGTAEVLFPDPTHSVCSFTIDEKALMPERSKTDNTIRTKGLFRRTEPIRVVPVAALPDPKATQVNLAPVIGWNYANGFMAGIASYSNPIIRPKTEYLLMPLFGLRNSSPAGVARIEHKYFPPSGYLGKITFGMELKQYGVSNLLSNGDGPAIHLSYRRVMPWIELQARKKDPVNDPISRITFRMMLISRDQMEFNAEKDYFIQEKPDLNLANELIFRYRSNRILNPFNAKVSLLQMGKILRFSAEENWVVSYAFPGKGFSIRAFTGVMLIPVENAPFFAGFTTGGVAMNTRDFFNIHDPWYDHLYLARNDVPGILRQHFYRTDGGFSRMTTVGNTNRWMLTLNMSTTLPGRLPFQLFLDAGIFADDSKENFFQGMFLYSSGVKIDIIKNVAAVYFPFTFFESKAFDEREQLNKLDLNYFKKIRFTLNLNALNPLLLPSRIRF